MKKFTLNLLALLAVLASTEALAQLNIPVPTGPAGAAAARPPGLYVQVLDGLIHVINPSGSSSFSSGQFGFTPSISTPPAPIPRNPVIPFTPPPQFNISSGSNPSGSNKAAAIDCVVR